MARKPSRSTNIRAPFSASSTAPSKATKTKSKRKLDPTNAYTYLPSLPKRSRTNEAQLSLSKDESGPSSPRRRGGNKGEEDEDEDEAMEERIRKLGMMIADDEGLGEVDSDESDVDSDLAWGSDGSDEERWGDVFRDLEKRRAKGSKGKEKEIVMRPAKPIMVDLNEDDDDPDAERSPRTAYKSAFGEEEEELSEVEDEDEGSEGEDDDEGENEEDEEGDENEDDEDSEDDDDELELPSDLSDEDEPSALDGLDAFVEQLASADKKRKSDSEGVQKDTKKRRVLPVVPGPGLKDASDFGLKNNQKLDLSALIASHPSLSSAASLLPSKADKKSSSQILKQGILSAPLPTVVQDRLDREAAYEKTKEEGQKWAGVMKRIKEADHLSFPLQPDDRGGVKSGGEMVSGFKPSNKLESAVTALLDRANLTDKNLTEKEDEALKAQDLSIEEIAARRAELRHQRELMFRAEARSKRVAKIKSKTFRKLARKREARNGEAADEINPLDEDEEREKLERDRARERATLRHGARSGKWARDVGGDATEIEDRRKEKEEMLDIKERLTRRIHGKGDDESSDEESEDEEDDESEVKERAFDQLNKLDGKDKPEDGSGKGLMGMAFMKKAQERGMKRVAEEEKELRRDIQLFGEAGEGDDGPSEDEEEESSMMKVGGNEGRMMFGPTLSTASTLQDDSFPSNPTPITTSTSRPLPTAPTEQFQKDINPWLTATTSSSGPSRKSNKTLTGNSKAADKTSKTLKKAIRGTGEDDGEVEISLDGPAGKDGDEEAVRDLMPNGLKAFGQRDLVAEAFAGDNVVEDFEEEKRRQIEMDAPKVEDTSLPGWGAWGGRGTRKRKTDPRFLKTTEGILPTQRKDFTRSNVIITEKKDKKASAFLVKDLPYPYTSVEQYEASLRTPVGSEWNSRIGFQRETVPRIQKKAGAIIEPVRRMF